MVVDTVLDKIYVILSWNDADMACFYSYVTSTIPTLLSYGTRILYHTEFG